MKKLKVILIGAGNRGRIYVRHMKEHPFEVVAVADMVKERRDYVKNLYDIPEEMCFATWEELLSRPKFADIAIIATSDSLHYGPAMKAIELGYDLLLEKPVAPTPEECADIANAAKAKGVKILVCHVLRYAPFFTTIKEYIQSGKLGKIISIHHCENVGNVHHSHSYVRGNWGNTGRSSCMLLAKSCHDIDIIQWLMGSKCTKVSSFGSLTYFTEENAPADATERCIDCPHVKDCYYSAVRIYVNNENEIGCRDYCTPEVNPTDEQVMEALKTTQYGKCVYKCDNDVVDHQVVNMEFENGGTASFNMSSLNKGGRFIRVMGTDGEIYGDMTENTIQYFDFKTRTFETTMPTGKKLDDTIVGGHGGGDQGIVKALYDYIANDNKDEWLSEIGISVQNHLATFAAEKARLEERVVNVVDYEKEFLK